MDVGQIGLKGRAKQVQDCRFHYRKSQIKRSSTTYVDTCFARSSLVHLHTTT